MSTFTCTRWLAKCAAFCLVLTLPAQAQVPDLAIRGVTVIDVTDGSVRPEQTVLVEGTRIARVGRVRDVEVPPGAEGVEAAGDYLIPGLWDMHVHSSSDRITRETIFPMYVANRVTGVRDMHADRFEPSERYDRGKAG